MKLKRVFAALTAVMMLSSIAPLTANAYVIGQSELRPVDGVLTVPEEINGETVTGLGSLSLAFSSAKELVLPATLEQFGLECAKCSGFEKVTMAPGLKRLGPEMFMACTKLSDVTFSQELTEIPSLCFYNTALEEAGLPKTLKKIARGAFAKTSLTGVALPEGLETVDDYAFITCRMDQIRIPASVTTIGERAFGYMTNAELYQGGAPGFVEEYWTPIEGFTISGFKNTEAEQYAEDNGFTFIALDDRLGDIDQNNSVTAGDAVQVMNYYLDCMLEATPEQDIDVTAADIDGDGEVSAIDAQYILIYFLNNSVLDGTLTWPELLAG